MRDRTYDRTYQQKLFAQRTPYLQWLSAQEDMERTLDRPDAGKQICTLPFSSCMDKVSGYGTFLADAVYLFARTGGSLTPGAERVIAEAFGDHPETALVYADEDYCGSLSALYRIDDETAQGKTYRGAPWFKPDFSPDTLYSFFYLGSVFAVRGGALLGITGEHGKDISLYELVYWIFREVLMKERSRQESEVVHLAKVLYTNDALASADWLDGAGQIKKLYQTEVLPEEPVSVIIPSKDNAKILRRCLETLIQYTAYDRYELIIVDNGSSPAQRTQIEQLLKEAAQKKPGLETIYLYEARPFNFSAMCNRGAQSASGSYLLFLNDDIEVMDTGEGAGWLARMVDIARRPHVGAVGAKLYYPPLQDEKGPYRIQHAGIANMGIGPAHKLGGMVDTGCLYHGHNTQSYDMLAVTAACMLVRKSVFDAAGGFDETLAVAYNDVAFCFGLYQSGYFNVQVNEAVLIHHESLSRGQDTAPDQRKRLAEEKARLYAKFPAFRAWDPFYSPHLVQWKRDVDYTANYLYACDQLLLPRQMPDAERRKLTGRHGETGILGKIYDRMTGYHLLMVHIDSVEQEEETVTINGWCVQRARSNAGISRQLCLYHIDMAYLFEIPPKLREDVAEVFAADGRTTQTALSGIQVRFERRSLWRGRYRIAVLFHGKQLVFAADDKGGQIEIEI